MNTAVKRSSWINHLPSPITRGLMRKLEDHANLLHPSRFRTYTLTLANFEDMVRRRMKIWMSHRELRMGRLNRKAARFVISWAGLGGPSLLRTVFGLVLAKKCFYANGEISNAIYYNDYYLWVHQNSVLRACWDCYSHFYSFEASLIFLLNCPKLLCGIEYRLGQDNNCPFASTDDGRKSILQSSGSKWQWIRLGWCRGDTSPNK